MNKKAFIKKYPLTLQELLLSPSVYRENFPFLENLPYPGIHHMRDICEYAGYTYGALRTALSRIMRTKKIDFFTDENKIKRFRLTPSQLNVKEVLTSDIGDAKDFSIVIFSFTTKQEKQRRDARFLLQAFGFRLFAQNTYIRRKIQREPFENSLKEYGLLNNVFLFECLDPGTEEFKNRLFTQFNMEEAIRLTNTFYADLNNFLSDDLDEMEYSRRILYIGPVYYNICYAQEVPVPENYYPENYSIKQLKLYFQSIPESRWKDFISYHMHIENKGR
ncbi:MAG: hypothetical protein JXJ04_13860 [Spirochaetales bacterium]|nr:hypothetical protein [Spirochaetales bacterium]